MRSGLVAVVTSVALAFTTPAFASPPQASADGTPPPASASGGVTSPAPLPATVLPVLGDPLELTHGRLALQPLEIGGALGTALPSGATTQTILTHDAKIAIIVVAIVVGVLLLIAITYSATRPCCGPF